METTLSDRTKSDNTQTTENKNIVLFDGVCALCNHSIDYLIKLDTDLNLKYAPLQGETAKTIFSRHTIHDDALKSIIFVKKTAGGEIIYKRSDAVLESIKAIGGFWKIASLFKVIPKSIRDRIYDFIARNRYKWFGKYETCRLPSPEERELFLP